MKRITLLIVLCASLSGCNAVKRSLVGPFPAAGSPFGPPVDVTVITVTTTTKTVPAAK